MSPGIVPTAAVPAGDDVALATSQKLARAAREFESILLQSWLEKMNQSFVGESGSQDPAHDTVSSLGSQAIATALAERGGIGIANMILRQLHPRLASGPQRGAEVPQNQVVHRDGETGRQDPGGARKKSVGKD
ncbi:MAG TPA: hypothetical protein VL240_01410 [Candidatus Binatia bacterium]|nr:hypothetical protein [Candidatus Binatia bacterium]